MRTPHSAKYLALIGLSGLAFLVGCVAEDSPGDETQQAYALRSELSGSAEDKKTYVCHIPPGNPANAHTIHVGNAAVDAHLAHGDSLGACPGSYGTPPTSSDCRGKGRGKKSIQNVIKREGRSWKAVVCHIPPGNPENAHTIEVGIPAVRAHLAHGDSLGACPIADDVILPVVDCPETGSDGGGNTDGGDTGTGTGPGTDTGTDTGTGTGSGTGTSTDTGTDTVVEPTDNT